MLKFVKSIDDVSEPKLSDHQVNTLFELSWPRFVDAIDAIRARQAERASEGDALPRKPDELLGEILERVRSLTIGQQVLLNRSSHFKTHVQRTGETTEDSQFVGYLGVGVERVISMDDDVVWLESTEPTYTRTRVPRDMFGNLPIRSSIAESQQDYDQLKLLWDYLKVLESAGEPPDDVRKKLIDFVRTMPVTEESPNDESPGSDGSPAKA